MKYLLKTKLSTRHATGRNKSISMKLFTDKESMDNHMKEIQTEIDEYQKNKRTDPKKFLLSKSVLFVIYETGSWSDLTMEELNTLKASEFIEVMDTIKNL